MYTLISHLTMKPGCEVAARKALKKLARQVQQHEPDTLFYLVHVPDMKEESLPTPSPLGVVFIEGYKNRAAFQAHRTGPVFKNFLAAHLDLFLKSTTTGQDGLPAVKQFSMIEILKREGGFIRACCAE